MRSVLYRFPDLDAFERVVQVAAVEADLGLPPGESVDDGEWVLAIFELGPGRRATSVAGRGAVSPESARLIFEPRDLRRLAEFARGHEGGTPPLHPPPDQAAAGLQSRATTDAVPETARSAGRNAEAPPANPRVLIVDDDPDIRDVVSAMLEAVGLTVVTVESGEEALERVAREAFDLLVLDWNLPRMTGLDLCRAIRKDPRLPALPVLFLTANASSQDMVEAFASGGDDYVVKPFRAPELGARLFSLLRRARRTSFLP